MVASELVTNSALHAGTDLDLSIAWGQGALRLTVRDSSPNLGPRMHQEQGGLLATHGRGLSIVTGLTRGFGVLPTTDGGRVLWAVLDAPATPFEQQTTY